MHPIIEKSAMIHGLSIAYTETGNPQGRILFCVHGLLSNGRDYDALGQVMDARGYRIISMDLPGRGKSGWFADITQYSPPHYIPYVLGLIAAATNGAGFDYMGVSLGGIIGMAIAGLEGLKMERLVLVDVGAEVPATGLDAVSVLAKTNPHFKTKEDAVTFLKSRCGSWGITQEETWTHLIAHNIVQEGEGWRMHYDPAIGEILPLKNENVIFWPVWEKIKQPVLLVRGGKSILLPQAVAVKMAQVYAGEKFEEIVFPECGHVPNLMEKEQIERVAGWFGNTTPPP